MSKHHINYQVAEDIDDPNTIIFSLSGTCYKIDSEEKKIIIESMVMMLGKHLFALANGIEPDSISEISTRAGT